MIRRRRPFSFFPLRLFLLPLSPLSSSISPKSVPLSTDSMDSSLLLQHKGEASCADHGFCAICLEKIPLQETALVKGCEHAYCVSCILVWATYNQNPSCPQCKNPFQFLNVHRSLDGCIHDYMFEESVCLLLRATWFLPLKVDAPEEVYEEQDVYPYEYYEDDDEDLDDSYFIGTSSSLRIGNRRWGDNGYIRAGRKEAKPVDHSKDSGAGSSRGKQKDVKGRRAKRTMKREAADMAAAAKHQQHLQRLGLN